MTTHSSLASGSALGSGSLIPRPLNTPKEAVYEAVSFFSSFENNLTPPSIESELLTSVPTPIAAPNWCETFVGIGIASFASITNFVTIRQKEVSDHLSHSRAILLLNVRIPEKCHSLAHPIECIHKHDLPL